VYGIFTCSGSASWSCPFSHASISSAIRWPTGGAFLNWFPLVPTAMPTRLKEDFRGSGWGYRIPLGPPVVIFTTFVQFRDYFACPIAQPRSVVLSNLADPWPRPPPSRDSAARRVVGRRPIGNPRRQQNR
jgi:hypothetical protein